jgi:hypothetical protein
MNWRGNGNERKAIQGSAYPAERDLAAAITEKFRCETK